MYLTQIACQPVSHWSSSMSTQLCWVMSAWAVSDGQRGHVHAYAHGLWELIAPAARTAFSVAWQVPTPIPLPGLQQKGWVFHLYHRDFEEWLCWGTAGRCSRTGCTRHLSRSATGNRDRSHLQLSRGLSCLQRQWRGTAVQRFSFQHPLRVPGGGGCADSQGVWSWGYCRINHRCKSHGSVSLPYNSGWRGLAPEEEPSTAAHTINHNDVCTDYSCYRTKV